MKPNLSLKSPWRWPSFVGWCLVFALLWLLLSGGEGLGFGVAGVLGAAALAAWLGPSIRLPGWPSLPGFLWFFLRASVHGGWDVARRAWQPSLPIAPGWVEYSMRSEDARVRLMLSAMVGLLPGTLASHFEQERLFVHALDTTQDWQPTVVELERRLIRLLEGQA